MATYEKTKDGYTVTHDNGKGGCSVDHVVMVNDPAKAERNRKHLNDLLARYGYELQKGGDQESADQAAG